MGYISRLNLLPAVTIKDTLFNDVLLACLPNVTN
jgi:hypothetical protein